MNLNEYLFYEKITRTEAARQLDADSRYLGQVALGHRKPGKKLMKAIEKFTAGKVPLSYWQSEEYRDYLEKNRKEYDK